MNTNLKVFILEDRKADLALAKRAVLKQFKDATFTVATSKEEFLDKIHWISYDIVLADYHLPGYNGLDALLYVRAHLPHLPFVFVTGTLNSEESVAQAILKGGNGFVLKDNLKDLPQQMIAALNWGEQQKGAHLAEKQRQQALHLGIQKALGLLEGSSPFLKKDEITRELETLLKL